MRGRRAPSMARSRPDGPNGPNSPAVTACWRNGGSRGACCRDSPHTSGAFFLLKCDRPQLDKAPLTTWCVGLKEETCLKLVVWVGGLRRSLTTVILSCSRLFFKFYCNCSIPLLSCSWNEDNKIAEVTDFSAYFCGLSTNSHGTVGNPEQNLGSVAVKSNKAEAQKLVKNISSLISTLFFLSPAGREVHRTVSNHSLSDFSTQLFHICI